jgi:ankyrin repeat protein
MLKEKLDVLIQALDKNDIRKWSNRVDNKLFYNESYLPVPREKREIEEIVEQFSSVGGLQDRTHQRIIDCLLSPNNKPRSVLLKREPVIYSKAGNEPNETLIDLILLNHSFIISLNPDSPQTKHESKGTNEIKQAASLVIGMTKTFSKNVDILLGKKTIEGCFDLKSILGITDYDADENGTAFSLIVKDEENNILRAHFTCGSIERKNEWVNAFKMSVLQRCEMEESSLLAAALCNDISMIIQSVESNTLEIDETNNTFGCTSLHIAIINNNLDIATELLKGGANANINCKDDFPPLYYGKI